MKNSLKRDEMRAISGGTESNNGRCSECTKQSDCYGGAYGIGYCVTNYAPCNMPDKQVCM